MIDLRQGARVERAAGAVQAENEEAMTEPKVTMEQRVASLRERVERAVMGARTRDEVRALLADHAQLTAERDALRAACEAALQWMVTYHALPHAHAPTVIDQLRSALKGTP